MKTFEIFPTVITQFKFESFSKEEKYKLINEKYVSGSYFSLSENLNILNVVPKLKAWIEDKLSQYVSEVMCTDNELVITQSWCLLHSGVPQIVKPHRHSNSIVSGSYYVVAPPSTTGISFFKNSAENTVEHTLIEWQTKSKERKWLKTTETLEVKENDLILFPSQVSHGVQSDIISPRVVLAFNTWFKHPIGIREKLNLLEGLNRD